MQNKCGIKTKNANVEQMSTKKEKECQLKMTNSTSPLNKSNQIKSHQIISNQIGKEFPLTTNHRAQKDYTKPHADFGFTPSVEN